VEELKGSTAAIVKLKNGEMKEFSLRKLKFLARAYTCNVDDVDMPSDVT
jgi:DNA-binding Xre family transcriptional regulator